jgi:glycosyltransferase involved in cell wall biosynthesis
MNMRIGIDARNLGQPMTGIVRICSNLINALARIDKKNEYFLYSRPEFELPFHDPRWHKRVWHKRRFAPLQNSIGTMIKEDKIDVFWETYQLLPLRVPSGVRKVLSLYDFAWKLFPQVSAPGAYLPLRLFTKSSIRRADRLICDSQCTLQDIGTVLNLRTQKAVVIYPGVLPEYRPRNPKAAAEYIAGKYGTSKEYICSVGTIEPRKNLVTLVEAFRILRDRGEVRAQLLIAGGYGWKNSEIYESVSRAGLTEKEIKFLGYIPEEDLPLFFSGAKIFVFPSIYEGFGIPLIEAMGCGVPVVASNVSSIPEVLLGAGLLVSPRRPQEFADAIDSLIQNPSLREELIQRGTRRASEFRYENSAKQLLTIFEELGTETTVATAGQRSNVGS